jgi:DNA-directed RNA polymerase subunit RPC12/RpoP
MTKLKTLEMHNGERWAAQYERLNAALPHPNGIECPKCGKELWDSDPMVTLTSHPAQKNVHCPACRHNGYRLA